MVFTGAVPYGDLPRYYASADIYCSPATGGESFGIVLLEAMAAGKPVVASNIEGYAGILTHGQEGLLFPRKDTESLADALGSLIRDPELRSKLGAQGLKSVAQYRWDRVASQVEDFYHERLSLANGRTRQRADKRIHP